MQLLSDITAGAPSFHGRRSSEILIGLCVLYGLGVELLSGNHENSWNLTTESNDEVFYYHLALSSPMRFNEIGSQAEDAEIFYAMQAVSILLVSAGKAESCSLAPWNDLHVWS